IEEGPHPICFFVPERHTQKSVAGSLDESELDPRDIVRDTIHEIGRIEKYGGHVFFEFGEEGGDERLAPLRLARLAELCKRFVRRSVGIAGDVEAGVVALRAVPKSKEVEFAADDLAEEERVVLARADDVLRQVALLVYLDVDLRAHGTPRLAQKLRRRAQLRHVGRRKVEPERHGRSVFARSGSLLEHSGAIELPAFGNKPLLRGGGKLRAGRRGFGESGAPEQGGRDRPVQGRAVAAEHRLHQLGAVDSVVERLAHLRRAQYGRLVLIEKDSKDAVLRRGFYVLCAQVLEIAGREAACGVNFVALERGQERALALVEADIKAPEVRLAERAAGKRVECVRRRDAGGGARNRIYFIRAGAYWRGIELGERKFFVRNAAPACFWQNAQRQIFYKRRVSGLEGKAHGFLVDRFRHDAVP